MAHTVEDIQRQLKAKWFDPGLIDGKFGMLTQGAIKRFQKSRNLAETGSLNPFTETALFGTPGIAAKPSLLKILFAFLALKRSFEMNTITAKSAWFSKINWTQAISFAAMLLAFFGFDLDAKTQAEILAAILAITNVATWAFRTFGNNTVSPDMAGKTVTVVKGTGA